MTKQNNKINIPKWWSESFLSQMAQTSSQFMTGKPVPQIIPPMHSHELQVLMLLLGVIQRKLAGVNDGNHIQLKLIEVMDEYPFLNEIDRLSLVKMFYCLPALRLPKREGEFSNVLKPLLNIQEVHLDEMSLQVQDSELEDIFGYTDHYFCNATLSENAQVLQIDPRLWMKLEGVDRSIFLIIMTELYSRTDISTDSVLEISEAKFHNRISDKDLDFRSVIQGFASRLGRLGYLDPIESKDHSTQYVSFNLSGSVVLKVNDELHPPIDQSAMQTYAKLSIERFDFTTIVGKASKFYGTNIDGEVYRQLKNFWTRVLEYPDQYGGSIWIKGLGVIQIPILFIEWCMRNSPLHANPLPHQIQNSLFSDLCYISHENLDGNYTRFRKILLHDHHVKAFISRHSSEVVNSISKTDDSKQAPSEPKMTVKEPESIKVEVPVPSIKSHVTDEVTAEEPKTPIDEIVRKNRLNSINIADSELWRIKKYDSAQYQSLKRQYIQSLEEIDQKVLKEVESQMRKDLFEQQIHKRIVKYMVSNPGHWSSVSSRG